MAITIQQAIDAGEALTNHPYKLLGLSDREKFHTGFLAFCLEHDNPGFFNALFINPPGSYPKIYVDVEEKSLDLVVRAEENKESPCVAVAEVKLKTDLHDEQEQKYIEKVKKDGASGLVIGLFEPIGVKLEPLSFVDITKEVPDILEKRLDANKFGADEKTLVRLWKEYLKNLGMIKSYFEEQKTDAIDRRVVDILRNIKLKGIFERYRHGLVAERLQDLTFRQDLPKDGQGKKPIDIGNSHGSGILDLYKIPRPKKEKQGVQMGLQWQSGLLKVFVHHKKVSDSRNKLLERIAETIQKSAKLPQFEVKLNKDGKFRSVTLIDKGWDVLLDPISDKHEILRAVFYLLDDFVDEARHLETGTTSK